MEFEYLLDQKQGLQITANGEKKPLNDFLRGLSQPQQDIVLQKVGGGFFEALLKRDPDTKIGSLYSPTAPAETPTEPAETQTPDEELLQKMLGGDGDESGFTEELKQQVFEPKEPEIVPQVEGTKQAGKQQAYQQITDIVAQRAANLQVADTADAAEAEAERLRAERASEEAQQRAREEEAKRLREEEIKRAREAENKARELAAKEEADRKAREEAERAQEAEKQRQAEPPKTEEGKVPEEEEKKAVQVNFISESEPEKILQELERAGISLDEFVKIGKGESEEAKQITIRPPLIIISGKNQEGQQNTIVIALNKGEVTGYRPSGYQWSFMNKAGENVSYSNPMFPDVMLTALSNIIPSSTERVREELLKNKELLKSLAVPRIEGSKLDSRSEISNYYFQPNEQGEWVAFTGAQPPDDAETVSAFFTRIRQPDKIPMFKGFASNKILNLLMQAGDFREATLAKPAEEAGKTPVIIEVEEPTGPAGPAEPAAEEEAVSPPLPEAPKSFERTLQEKGRAVDILEDPAQVTEFLTTQMGFDAELLQAYNLPEGLQDCQPPLKYTTRSMSDFITTILIFPAKDNSTFKIITATTVEADYLDLPQTNDEAIEKDMPGALRTHLYNDAGNLCSEEDFNDLKQRKLIPEARDFTSINELSLKCFSWYSPEKDPQLQQRQFNQALGEHLLNQDLAQRLAQSGIEIKGKGSV